MIYPWPTTQLKKKPQVVSALNYTLESIEATKRILECHPYFHKNNYLVGKLFSIKHDGYMYTKLKENISYELMYHYCQVFKLSMYIEMNRIDVVFCKY